MDLGKVLVVDDVDAIREIVIFYLLSVAQAEVIEANCGTDALNKFKNNPDIKLVISDQNMPNGTGVDLYLALRDVSQIPFIMHTTDPVEMHNTLSKQPGFYFLPKPMEIAKLEDLLTNIQKQYATQATVNEIEKYIPVRLSLIRKMGKTNVPLHIRISDNKYVKIQKEGDIDQDFMVDREKQNQIHILYIKQSDVHEYIADYQKYIQSTIDSPETKVQKQLTQALTTAELLQTVQTSIGISKDVEELVQQNIKSVTQLAQQKTEFKSIAEDLQNSDANPNAKLIVLVSMLAIAIGKELNWISEKTSNKFIFAAIIHDMVISHEEHEREHYKNAADCSALYKNHPNKASEIANKWNACPGDVGIILQQHHELPDGTGFPYGLNTSRISPLSSVFIVAHELAEYFNKSGKNPNIETWLKLNQLKFSEGDFKKAFGAVVSLHKNNSKAA